jgi:hypothetical protein
MALPILDGNQSATTLSTVLSGGEHTPAHTVVSLGSVAISNITSAVSGSVVSISNFPASQTIAGTVTANLVGKHIATNDPISTNGSGAVRASLVPDSQTQICDDDGNSYTIANPLPISGTVTANVRFAADVGETMPPQAIALGFYSGDDAGIAAVNDSTRRLPISGTVTANNPSGALTTRFGSVTTANTAQLTSAVTNTSRKYLLVQNIATSTVTIGIGFAPTTTQGIQLTAGAGLTFDAFTPTGAIYWLSSVTGSNFSILEG